MLPVSDAFLAALRGSHTVAVSAVLCDPPGQVGVTPTGRELAVVDGSVTLDGEADVRGALDLTVAEGWPGELSATELTPWGAEVFVTRGVRLGNGVTQRAPLGYFRIQSVEQADAPTGALRLTGQDRMSAIVDARFPVPVQFTAGATYGAVIADLVDDVYPGVAAFIDWDDATSSQALGRTVIGEEDRYALLLDLVRSVGKVFYWDYRGHLAIRTPPDASAPVWEVDAGRGGVLVSLGRALSRAGVHNAVIARGEGLDSAAPVSAAAYDTDPASPTRWDGPFGKVPTFYSSPLLVTTDQALLAAQSLLAQSIGLPYLVDFTAVPNPALEPGDPVRVVYPVDRTRAPHVQRETHVLTEVTIPLGTAGALGARTRKVTL